MDISDPKSDEAEDNILSTVTNIIKSYGVRVRVMVPDRVTQLTWIQGARLDLLERPISDCYDKNNFIVHVESNEPTHLKTNHFGTSPTDAAGVHEFIIRLANPKAKHLNHVNRIQNTVANMALARETMMQMDSLQKHGLVNVVPAVYGWMPGTPGNATDLNESGWIMYEYKKGDNLAKVFPELAHREKVETVGQIAAILHGLQSIRRPRKVVQFGGLDFDAEGNMVSAGMPNLRYRVWDLYSDVWIAKVRDIVEGDFQPRGIIKEWKQEGFIKRLKTFLTSNGLKRALDGIDMSQMVLVHGDFSKFISSRSNAFVVCFRQPKDIPLTFADLNNMLFDRQTKKITALLDFDLASIANPADEFFNGLMDVGGGLIDEPAGLLTCILSGDFTRQPENVSQAEIEKWHLAKAWQDVSKREMTVTPSCIQGVGQLLNLHQMLLELHVPMLPNEGKGKRKLDQRDSNLIKEIQEMTERVAAVVGGYGF